MPRIVVLDEATANQIAAGEVVERPASVVKELVENSLDAGATAVYVDIEEGGLRRIVVRDNGCGMDEEDARLALLRYATSKIRSAADLHRITTLGFRGEALPSIAAVCRMTIKTRPPFMEHGTFLRVEAGKVVESGSVAMAPGTVITVEDLFYNTPARKKYLKTPATEGGLVGDCVGRLALAHPEVAMRFFHNGRQVLATSGSGDMLEVVAAVYGLDLAREMIRVEDRSLEWLQVEGYAGRPGIHRSSRRHIVTIVNGRYVHCLPLVNAICEAYHTMLPAGRYPVAVIAVSLPPALVDVNVHPAKLEVRLAREKEVSRAVTAAVRAVLQGSRRSIPGVIMPEGVSKADPGPGQKGSAGMRAGLQADLWQLGEAAPAYRAAPPPFPQLHYLARLGPAYLLAAGPDGLYIVDQHAAHERVLYEKYMEELTSRGRIGIQRLAVPLQVALTYGEASVLEEHRELLYSLGFELDFWGPGTVVLRGAPAGFPGEVGETFLRDVATALEEWGRLPPGEKLYQRLLSQLACRMAVKAGEEMAEEAARFLLRELAAAQNPFTCPHGRPTTIHLSYRELERRFGRSSNRPG
ncbi:DNA mismatch repair endonuclease MutL [Desulfovirgula thermocuniculi]|uniref:DNA mismatch repair endonuclease MutL n=1 Tax=Desulfovirgula thermocuniculi TaxID=348842 RepID=UPI00042813C4|nr:DNA mismatch repair endonuclease MutL [Desulfovirgula thermocuniculi]